LVSPVAGRINSSVAKHFVLNPGPEVSSHGAVTAEMVQHRFGWHFAQSDGFLTCARKLPLSFRCFADGKVVIERRQRCKTSGVLDRVAGQLERYMDLLSMRQKLVASNIANVDTPGYQTQDIDFQTEFQSSMSGSPTVVGVAGLAVKNDGNNVSLDRESRLLAENALRFQMASSLLRGEINQIRSAINEGKAS
jgi:flagellar basal-body rod protein FlgB